MSNPFSRFRLPRIRYDGLRASPHAVESPEGARGTTVVDSDLATWTIANGACLRDGVDTGGRGSEYWYSDHTVHALGTDGNWWKQTTIWTDAGVVPPEPPELVESAEGTHDVTVVDSLLTTWTLNADGWCVRDGVQTAGKGGLYCYHDHLVYVKGTDQNWWLFDDSDDSWSNAGSVDPAPAHPDPVDTRSAVNLTISAFYGGCKPWINVLKSGSRWWNIGGVNAEEYVDPVNNWLYGMPPGYYVSNLLQVRDVEGEYDMTELRAGTWVLLWKGPLDLSIRGFGVDPGRVESPGRYVFNVPATIEVDGVLCLANPALDLDVRNPTDTPQNLEPIEIDGVQYPVLMHIDDEPDYMAGKHYCSAFLNALNNAKVTRDMDWHDTSQAGCSSDGTVQVFEFEPHNIAERLIRTYVGNDTVKFIMPPEELAALACEAKVSIWNNMPSRCTDACIDSWAQRFSAAVGPDWEEDVLSENGNEVWNDHWPWWSGQQYLLETIAPTIRVVDQHGNPASDIESQRGCACADRAIKQWTITERYIPRERHKRILAGQFSAGIDRNGMGGMFAYVDPVSGKRAWELADYYAVAPYWGPVFPDGCTLDIMLNERLWETISEDDWIERCMAGVDMGHERLQWNWDYLQRYAPDLPLTCYEGGGWMCPWRLPHSWEQNYKAAKDYDDWCRAFLDGEPGRIITEYYFETFIKGNFALFNHFFHGGYTLGMQAGLAYSQHRPDTPRQAFFRSL